MAGTNAAGQTGVFFEQSKPQYNDVDASSFYSVKELGAKGQLPYPQCLWTSKLTLIKATG
jgi:hypothetical protein